jgi:hypothetical protein
MQSGINLRSPNHTPDLVDRTFRPAPEERGITQAQ